MSVDPVIQSPGNSQSLNPYSYIMNNPLAGTDPTGYAAEEIEKKVKVSQTGSRIKRTVTVKATSNGSGGATVTISGGNGAARSAVKGALTSKLTGAGFNVSDIGSQGNIAKGGGVGGRNQKSNTLDQYKGELSGFDSELASMNQDSNDLGQTAAMDWSGDRAMAYQLGGQAGVDAYNNGLDNGLEIGVMAAPIPVLWAGKLYAGAKIIGKAQSTGTMGHAFLSKSFAYAYALNPRVARVSMDLGYKRAFAGIKQMRLKYGPRPDVMAVYKNGSVRVKEIASKTDKASILIERNSRKMLREGITGPAPSVNNWAVHLQKMFGK